MSGYLKYFKTELIMGLQYRAAAISGLFTQVFWGILFCLLYESFYSYTKIEVISYSELITYVWLMQSLITLVNIRGNCVDIIASIKNGTVAYELCRPYNLYYWWYIKIISKRYAAVALRALPIIIFGLLMPKPFNLALPISLEAFFLYIITLFLGSLIVVGISMIIHSISFFTLESKGISSIVSTIGDLLSGFAVPLPLLPNIIIKLTYFLPFRLIGDTPCRIYSGNMGISEAYMTVLFQIIWIVLLIIIGRIIINIALKKVCIQGG